VNVPQLQAMVQVTRTPWVAQQQGWIPSAGNVGNNNGGGGGTGGGPSRMAGSDGGATTNTPATRNRVRNPAQHRAFTGSSPLAVNIRNRRIFEVTALAGDPPTLNQNGSAKLTCVSWHAKGMCFEDCDRDHEVQLAAEATEFMGWCQLAFA
jgi:hypothetical protein